MSDEVNVKFIIMYGLPASGKTTYAKSKENKYDKIYRWDCDDVRSLYKSGSTLEEALREKINWQCWNKRTNITIILDGLFTTNEDLIKIVNIIKDTVNVNYSITVHYWDECREACKWNDSGRRKISSTLSIDTLPYERPSVSIIKKECGIDIKTETDFVKRKPIHEKIANEKGFTLQEGKYIYSDSWSTGGVSKDCWGGSYNLSEEEPVYFEAFDEFIKAIKPDLNFMDYNKIRRECITTDSYGEPDYYGGCAYYQRYVCDVEKLIEMLEVV